MADLRIVDAPEIPTENITGEEKIPTGGNGNYSISLDSLTDYTKTKKDLADNTTVDNKVNGVRQELNDHIEDLTNPHQVTKGQIGLGNVDNTADADKPVSNSTQAAIISAVTPKADKTYVDSQLAIKANKVDVYTKQESSDLVNNSISTALTHVNTTLDLAKRGIVNRYDPLFTYNSGERVVLTNGDIVKSTINGNTNNPNVDMTGWLFANYDAYSPNVITLQNIKGDGVTNDSTGLNSLADYVDLNKKDKLKFSSYNNNYHLESTVVIQEPTGLIGDKPATYDRGRGKDGGWFLLGNNVGTAFDLGNNRTYSTVYDKAQKTSPNPADFWTIKNIGIKTDVSVPKRTQNGISFTNQHNGADRGIYISEVSMKSLDKCIHIAEQANPNYWVTVATLNVNNSVLTESNYGVYAEGRSYQTAIEDNQIEQNYEASIYGNFDGTFRAVNNIMEGIQPSGIVFKSVLKAGNGPATQAIIESNYFEALKDSCIDISGNRQCAYWIRGNKKFGSKTKDYCIVRKGSVIRVYNEEQEYITLEDGAYLMLNSILTRNSIYGFYARPTSNTYDNSSVAHKLDALSPPIPSQITVNPSFTKTISKVRDRLCYVMTTQEVFPSATISFSGGDLLEISVLVYCDSVGNGLGINGSIGNDLVAAFNPQLVANEWVVTTVVARCAISGSSISFVPQINTATGTGFKIAGITVRNLGQYVAGEKYLVRPTQPTLHTIAGKHAQIYDYAGGTVSANGGVRKFDIVLSQYGDVGGIVKAALSVYAADLDVSAVIRTGGVVQITLKNNTITDIVVPPCKIRVCVL